MAIKNIFKKKQWKADYEAGRDAFNAGQFKAAETHLRSAMGKAIELDDSSYGDTALLLGQVMRRLERFEESLELTEKAFNYYNGFFGPADARSVAAHLSLVLADISKSSSDGTLRQATYHKAVEQFGSKSWQLVRTAALALSHLSGTEREKALGQAQDALTYALGEGRQELGAWPPVAEEFALELSRLGYTDLAARFMGHQLRVHEERFGDKSEEAALTRLTLGEFFLQCGEWRKAETALSKALEQIKLKHGPKSDLARRGTVCLGQALARQGRLEEAAPYLTESLEKLRGDQGTDRLEALVWLLEYKCMVAASDAERGALWRELEMAWESNTTEQARSRIYQGFCDAQRRLQEAWELAAADRFLQAVLNRVRQWRGPHHPDVAASMMDLGLCAALREDDAKALSYAEQSLALDEGADNLIRSVALYGELGERERAIQSAKMALRLVRTYPQGLEQGRRQAAFAVALLKAGDLQGALEQASAATEQLTETEKLHVQIVQAEVAVLQGQWTQAEALYKQTLPLLTEPVRRARAFLHYAWLLCQVGRFPEMQEALNEVQALASLRRDHPILVAAKAVASQGAFYSGNIYQGKEERDVVFTFLRKGQHQQTRRALSILTLLDPFGPDEYGTELDVGTQILAASRYPEAVCTVFPTKDVACMGLRHLTRALFFHGQEALAQERLSQYRGRFAEAYEGLDNPLASSLHLCAASLATAPSSKVEALEAARRGLRELGSRHVNLFPTLSLLAEQYIEVGALEQAKVTIAEALAIRKSGRLKDWLAALERGETPATSSEAAALREQTAGEPASPGNPYETVTQPPDAPETVTAAPSRPEPAAYQEPPRTEDETPVAPVQVPSLPIDFDNLNIEDSGTVVAYGGPTEVARIPMAVALSERDEPPSGEEVEAFLEEVKARFGTDRRARQDALFLLALLFPDGSETALELWNEALNDVFTEDFETLLHLENRARDANASHLVLATLKRRLSDEVGRYGDQATESIDTLTRMARAYETQGRLDEAYQRVMLTTEILRSWFGARSRRLLEPLAHLIRLCEKNDDVPAALEHHLERHRLLESGQSTPEELFSSRVALLPIRALLGQVPELMEEAATSQGELTALGSVAASEFASSLLPAALRLERLHWRVQEAVRLLEMALAAVPDSEVSLVCRLQVALAECQARRDYRSQAETLRKRTMDRVSALESESRAEILHEMAESCLRVRELAAAREVAEKVLEERIADGGRKDQWAGRSLLVLAEADLRSYRLEGTETAIAMSRPSLEGSPFWTRAQLLKCQSEFFLGREEEAYTILDALPADAALELQLALAVWRGRAEAICQDLEADPSSPSGQRWKNLESAPLDDAITLLELLARAGKVRLLQAGLRRIEDRLQNLLATDIRTARSNLLKAVLLLWERRWSEAEGLLQRVLDILPADRVEMPEGLSMLVVRGHLITSQLAQGKTKAAEAHAKTGAAEAAELLGEEDIRAIAFRGYTAYCADARGDQEESMVILDEVLAPLQDRLGETHVLLRDIYRGLSKCFSEQDDLESARLTAEEALRIDKECRGLSIHLVEDLHLLSKVERHEDLAEARNLLDTAVELADQVLPGEHPYRAALEADRQALETDEQAPSAAPISPQGDEDDDDYEAEASLDGWEVVEDDDDEVEASHEESVDALTEATLDEQADSREDFVEDSMFETPLVPLSRVALDSVEEPLHAEQEAGELELTSEERAEQEAGELELTPEERAEEEAAELELTSEERAEEEAAELELTPEERAEEEAAELELTPEERAEEEAAELELTPEERAEEEAAELELTSEERAEEEAAEPQPFEASPEGPAEDEASESSHEDQAQEQPELSIEEQADEDAVEPSIEEQAEEDAVEPSIEEQAEDDAVEPSIEEQNEDDVAELSIEELPEEDAPEVSIEEHSEVATQAAEPSDEEPRVEEDAVEPASAEKDRGKLELETAGELRETHATADPGQAHGEHADDEHADEQAGDEQADGEPADDEQADGERADDERADDERAGDEQADGEQAGDEQAHGEQAGDAQAAAVAEDSVPRPTPVAEESAEFDDAGALFGDDPAPEEPVNVPTEQARAEGLEPEPTGLAHSSVSAGSVPPYQTSTAYPTGPRATSTSVEPSPDFPTVPYRVPIISEVVETTPEEPELGEDAPELVEDAPELVEGAPQMVEDALEMVEDAPELVEDAPELVEDAPELVEDAPELVEDAPEVVETTPDEPEVVEDAPEESESQELFPEEVATEEPREDIEEAVSLDSVSEEASEPEWSSDEIPSELSEEDAGTTSISISIEQIVEQRDPEASLLPLAPVFFLPLPWKEATEAEFDEDFELLHERFQESFNTEGDWREIVDEAVSSVRLDPTPAGGYFLFLMGVELEKGNRLHTADLCLATAIELLDQGPAFGAACHLAGRVAGRRGELRRALDYFDRAAELAEELELAVLKVDAAECHLGLGRPEEALIGFEEVFDYLLGEVPSVQALAIQAKKAQIHLLIGDPDTSQALAEEVLQKLSPKNDGTYRVLGRVLLSRAFARLGRHELALELAETAWKGAQPWSSKRREGRRVAISNLVDIYSLLGKFEQAEEMIRESGLQGWGLAESELLLRAGYVACAQGKLETARNYLRLGQSFLTRFRSPALWRSSFMELEAELALRKGDAHLADKLSRQAMSLFEQEATGPVDRSRHLVRAARIAAALGDVSRARSLVEEAHGLRDLHLGSGHPHTESVEGLSAVFQ